MSKPETKPNDNAPSEDADRFDRLTRALFRVDKNDVPKHEPTKRNGATNDDDNTLPN